VGIFQSAWDRVLAATQDLGAAGAAIPVPASSNGQPV